MSRRTHSSHSSGVTNRLLARLVAADGRIVPRDNLLLSMYGDAEPDTATESLRVLIYKLRRRLPPDALKSHYAQGYSLDRDVARRLPKIDDRILCPAIED